jgi:predicted Zn-dependent peptidase
MITAQFQLHRFRVSRFRLQELNVFPLLLLLSSLGFGQTASGLKVPAHPRELEFPKLVYDPPKAANYRHVLSNGVVAFLAEDHDLPLVNMAVLVRTGSYLDPKGKEGLAAMSANQMRSGGTTHMKAETFDEEAAFLAANLTSSMGDTQGVVNLNCLTKDIDRALELFFDMLENPGFQPDRIALYKDQIVQGLERRNDETESILVREWTRLIRGDKHFSTAWTTKPSIESITREDLLAFHKKYYHPGGFIFAVSGDFNSQEMTGKLEKFMQGWTASNEQVPAVPKPSYVPKPGVYMVNKPDVNQGQVTLGHLATTRDNPDFYALSIMDDILGGGGFTSRIMSRVRSDEGLAYSAGSNFGFGVYYDGVFQAGFQSKSDTCAQATAIVLEEIEKIRNQKVSQDELETAKNYAVEVFPRNFATAAAIAATFANDEYTHRKPDFWETYRDRIRAVTADDVLRVAKKYLAPEKLVILAVGNVEDMLEGSQNKAEYTFKKFARGGEIQRIPLPNPLTMVYPKP